MDEQKFNEIVFSMLETDEEKGITASKLSMLHKKTYHEKWPAYWTSEVADLQRRCLKLGGDMYRSKKLGGYSVKSLLNRVTKKLLIYVENPQ